MNLLKPTSAELKCMDCHAKPATVTNKPCNHTVFCSTCSAKYREKNGDICSICKKTLTNPVYVPPTQITCDMCYDDFAPGFTVRASDDCDHHFCVRCMVDKFRFSLKNKKEAFDSFGSVPGMCCPMQPTGCTARVGISRVNIIERVSIADTAQPRLTDAEIKKYVRFSNEGIIPSQRRVFCTNKKCLGKDDDGNRYVLDTGLVANLSHGETKTDNRAADMDTEIQRLQIQETQAVKNKDYAEAGRLDARIKELNVEKTNLLTAGETKKKDTSAAEIAEEIERLAAQKIQAATNENYEEAARLKKVIEQLIHTKNNLIAKQNEEMKLMKFECGWCETEMCRRCRNFRTGGSVPWHEGITCQNSMLAAKAMVRDNQDQNKNQALIEATTMPCPNCNFRVTHWHGHECHHISPSTSGCPNCQTHWCYACGTAGSKGPWWCGSTPTCAERLGRGYCTNTDILNHIHDSSGWPQDDRCGCQFCPDCKEGAPCSLCGGNCVVCKGLVPSGETCGVLLEEMPSTGETKTNSVSRASL